jgi:fucose 4-O-acetylase-like acetyltransferase
MRAEKDLSIETLRGVAILLMVAGHVVGHDDGAGMRVPDDSAWRYVELSLAYMRMPLFTAISGYVYALRPVTAGHVGSFLWGKAHRVLLPLVTVGTLQFLLRTIIPGVNQPQEITDIWRVYVYGTDQFWFLLAIFHIFVLISVADRFRLLDRVPGWLLLLAAAVAVQLLLPFPPRIFSIRGMVYLLPYFILGVGACRHPQLFTRPVMAVVGLVLGVGIGVHQCALLGVIDLEVPDHNLTPLGVAVGLSANALLFYLRRPNRWLARLGYHAYTIYLFHVLPSAASRLLLRKLGIELPVVVFLVGMVAALGAPIVVERILRHSPLLTHLFLGMRPRRAKTA